MTAKFVAKNVGWLSGFDSANDKIIGNSVLLDGSWGSTTIDELTSQKINTKM